MLPIGGVALAVAAAARGAEPIVQITGVPIAPGWLLVALPFGIASCLGGFRVLIGGAWSEQHAA